MEPKRETQDTHSEALSDITTYPEKMMTSSRHHARGTSKRYCCQRYFLYSMSCCPKDSLNALKSDGTFKGSKINVKDVSYYATQDFENVKSGKVLIFYPDVRRFTFYNLSLSKVSLSKSLSVKMMKKKDHHHYISNRRRYPSQTCPIAL